MRASSRSSLACPRSLSQVCPGAARPRSTASTTGAHGRAFREAFAANARPARTSCSSAAPGAVLTRGALVGLAGPKMAELLDAQDLAGRALHRIRGRGFDPGGAAPTRARACWGRSSIACPRTRWTWPRAQWRRAWSGRAARVFGVVPDDPILHSVSVREIAEQTGATFLAVEEAAEELVEHFVVGAMTVESALRYFRRTPRKCVDHRRRPRRHPTRGAGNADQVPAAHRRPPAQPGGAEPRGRAVHPGAAGEAGHADHDHHHRDACWGRCACGSRARRSGRWTITSVTCSSRRWTRRWD